MKDKLISFDIKADFGFLKKPDINDGIYLTYNMLHKPSLLGILGAIIGLSGYKENFILPEYYLQLHDLAIGIEPLNSEKGNFPKTIIQYNNGVGYASREAGGNLIVKEQILIQPAFRCYILIPNEHSHALQLFENLFCREAVYLPYLGKNDFSLWWANVQEYQFQQFTFDEDFTISTIFMKSDNIVKDVIQRQTFSMFGNNKQLQSYITFEELPVGFDDKFMKAPKKFFQYEMKKFVYTNATFSKEFRLDGLYKLEESDDVIQLF